MSLTFDPEIAAALAPMAASGFTPPAVGDVAGRRAMWEPIIGAASTAQPIPADVTTSEHYATAEDGAQIKMRWYITDGATPGPAVLFFHGGGYIFGHIDLFDGPVSRYVSASGVPMLSVEYRRAPEHPYPTPLEDAYAALRWLNEHASELGVDPERVGVMGDSAGGGMAAALTILARERGGPKIARQILLMPMLDDRTRTPDPHIAPYALWSYDDSATAWPALLGEAAGGPDVPVTVDVVGDVDAGLEDVEAVVIVGGARLAWVGAGDEVARVGPRNLDCARDGGDVVVVAPETDAPRAVRLPAEVAGHRADRRLAPARAAVRRARDECTRHVPRVDSGRGVAGRQARRVGRVLA